MDALIVEAAATASCIGAAIALRKCSGRTRRVRLPPTLPIARSLRGLRRRHRRLGRAIVELACECLERHPDGSFEAFTAREALRSYLPETLAAYLAVPPALRGVPRHGRPSADDELSRQLRTVLGGLERIREADADAAATRMAANAAFLTDRFSSPDSRGAATRGSILGELRCALDSALRRA
jgi:hypothetical protein